MKGSQGKLKTCLMCLTIISPFWSFVFCFWLHQKPYVHDLVQADAFEALEQRGTL